MVRLKRLSNDRSAYAKSIASSPENLEAFNRGGSEKLRMVLKGCIHCADGPFLRLTASEKMAQYGRALCDCRRCLKRFKLCG
jgi:hypothetical protein